MATRSVIKVENLNTVQLYKHWDGNPAATLPWLKKFNQQFAENRGDDPPYKFAQLIRSSVLMAEEFNLDESTETGWGVVGYNDDIDQDYEYILHADGTVTYKAVIKQ